MTCYRGLYEKIEKIKNVVIAVLVILLIALASYYSSELSYYKNNCTLKEEESTDLPFLKSINMTEYVSLFKASELSFVYIGKDDCVYSQAENEVLKELKEEYKDITINYLNLDKLSEEELSSLYTSYQSFVDNGIGTPTLLLVSNSEVKMFKRGYTNKESLIELLKENKFIS